MKGITIRFILFLLTCSISFQLQGQNCNCKKYLYVNDQVINGVHKFELNESTGALSEISGPTGGLWYEGINRPHGGSFDLNGFLYIGEKFRNAEIAADPINNQANLKKSVHIYSHSMVAGGFELMSYTTLLTPGTLFIISLDVFCKNS